MNTERMLQLFKDNQLTYASRMEIAHMFKENNDETIVPHLIEEISNNPSNDSSSELIYILGHFDCSGLFEKVFLWSLSKNEEVSNEAVALLQSLLPSKEQYEKCMDYLDLMEKSNADNAEYLDFLKAMREVMLTFTIKEYNYGEDCQHYLH